MNTNEAAMLVSVPTHTVALATLIEAQTKLRNAGMHTLANILLRRIKTDPRQREIEQNNMSLAA